MNLSLVSRIASRLRSGDIPAPSTSGRQVCRRSLLASALLLISVIPAAFAAPFAPGNLVIYRVGNGASVLSTSGTLVFLDEYNTSGTLVQSIQLPAASPGVIGLVASGTSVSEGLLTRSISGRHLALTGFNAATSAVDLPSSLANSVSRTVGTVDWQGNTSATTALQNYSNGTSPRSALTSDNGSFWISGGSGGLHLAALGVATSTQIGIIPTSQRQIQAFGNQLYISSNSGAYRLATVGTGLPASIGQTITNLPGISTTNSTSPYGFFLADLSTSVAGNDTLYIADEVLGLQKFSLVGGTWTANGSIGTDADDYRGLTATVSGTSVTLYATTKGGNDADGGGELVKLTDSSGYNATLTGTPSVLATAANNTAFRGVALAPYNLPDLTVDLAAPATVQTGTSFTYTLTPKNIGNVEASDIDLFFVVPSGLTIGAINGASGFSGEVDANVVFFSGGSLAAGASATLTINVSSATAGTFTTAVQAAEIDSFDLISEADETNNDSTQLVSTVVSAPPQNFINLDLLGKGGAGLLSQNENGVISGTPGTGGEVGAGCRYETNSRVLSINVAWGTQNGFVDLSTAANNSHIHGPTTSAGAASFLQNAGVLFNLPRVSSTANGGSINTTVTLNAAQEADLLAGKYYINIHTSTNGGGEIRGNLVVPSNLPTITSHPSSQTIASGATATLTVAASGSPAPAFQWYRGNSGDTSNPILDANSATFTTPTLTTTTSYWVQATNASGPPANSNTATITVTPPATPYFGVTGVFLNGQWFGVGLDGVRTQETNLGNLVADSLLVHARGVEPCALAFLNAGAIRTSIGELLPDVNAPGGFLRQAPPANPALGLPLGAITQSTIDTVLAFNNGLTLITVSKAELRGLLEHGVANYSTDAVDGTGRFPQVSGLKFSFDPTRTAGDRIRSVALLDINGNFSEALVNNGAIVGDPNATLRIVTYDFLANGGDLYTFPSGPAANRIDLKAADAAPRTGLATFSVDGSQRDVFAEFMANRYPIGSPYNVADTTREFDTRIQNLTVRTDSVFASAGLPAITTQPANQTIPSGSTATLSVIATGNPAPTFQWYRGNSGDTSTPVGTNSASFTTPVLTANTNYWVRASNTSGIPADSNTVTVTVTPPVLGPGDIAFTGFNADSTDNLAFVALVPIPAGTVIYFTDNEWNGIEIGLGGAFIDAAESEFTWTAPAGGIAAGTVVLLNDVSGGISTSVGAAAMTITTNTGISNTSDTVYAFVGASQAPGAFVASIANHNADSLAGTSLVANNTAVFLPASTDGARYMGARSGQTSFSAYLAMIGNIGANWEITTGDGTAYLPFNNNAFTIETPEAPAITTQPASQTINSGNTAQLSVVATGFPAPTFQWYRGNTGDTSNPVGTNSTSFTTPALSATTNYWVRASNSSGPAASSNTATITVTSPPSITTQPANQTINSGSTATLTVVATGTAPLAYQWYRGDTGDTTTPVGTNSASFITPTLTVTTSYWVKITNAANLSGENSNTATVTVNQPAAISNHPASVTINSGSTTTLSVVASGTAPFTYQWYQGASGTTTTPVGTNSASFTTPGLTATTSYWVKITNAANPTGANSNTATVTVNQPAAITTQPANQTIISGSTATLSVVATGFPTPSFQWYRGNSGDETNLIASATSASFTTPPLTARTSYWVKVSNSSGPAVNSDTASVSINLLTNGSFELPVVAPPFRTFYAPNSSSIPGWIVSQGSIDFYVEWAAAQGNQSIDVSGEVPGTFYQDAVGLQPGATYRLHFELSGNPGAFNEIIKRLRVSAGPVISDFEFDITGSSNTNMGWTPKTLTFVAQTTSARIQFQSLNTGFSGPALDNVRLVLESPAPVSVAPVITTQPGSQTISSGETATLYVTATASPAPTYQWYRGDRGVTTSPVGTNSASFTTPALTATTSYWVQVSNGIGSPANSQTAVVTVLSSNANLSDLAISDGTLAPGFLANVTEYSAQVPFRTETLTVREIPEDAGATAAVRVNGGAWNSLVSGVFSAPAPLQVGNNQFEVEVMAGTGAKKTYSVMVERATALADPLYRYDFNSDGVFPNVAFYTNNGATPDDRYSVSGGYLRQRTAGVNVNNTFVFPATNFTGGGFVPEKASFIEARLDVQAIAGVGGAFFEIDDGSYRYLASFVPGGVIIGSVSDTSRFVALNHAGFHTYRLVSPANSGILYFYFDGELKFVTNADPADGLNSAAWGDGMSPGGNHADVDWDYITFGQLSDYVVPTPALVVEQPLGVAAASGAERDFGARLVGSSEQKTFVIRNSSAVSLTGVSAALQGAETGSFLLNVSNLSATLAPGAETSVTVSFTPASVGNHTASLVVTSNEPVASPHSITLKGSGEQIPTITPQPTPSQTVIYGSSVTLSGGASGSPVPSIQWYQGVSGNTSQPIEGATSSPFITPSLIASTSYWFRASNTRGSADSQTAFIEVEPISTNALLSNLVPSAGQLSPGFGSGTGFYTLLVPSSIAELTLTPFAAHPAASISINGVPVPSGNASQVIPIGFGENPINVIVTAQDGETIRSYLINAIRSQPMFVSTENASGITRTVATLNGTVIPYGTATVRFEYGQSTNYSFSTPPQQVSGSNIADVQFPLVNLLPGTRYHFRMVASNGVDTVVGSNRFFDTLPGDPLVLTGNPVDVTTASATLVGAVDGRGADVTIYFEYGTDFPLTKTAEQFIPAADGYKDVSANVSGLIPNANYQVRLVARVGTNPPTNGSLRTFIATTSDSTGGTPSGPPIVTTGDVVSITTNSAEIRGSVNAQGGTTAVWIEYGTTSALGLKGEVVREIGNTQGATDISIPISGLVSGMDYHYRVVAQNSLGNVPGQIDTFRTNFLPPDVSTGSVSVLSTTSVRVFGTVRANRSDATVRFRYGTSLGNLDLLIDAAPAIVTGDVNRTVSADLTNLRQGTRYYYQVEANNGGGEDVGSQRSFDVAILSGLDRRFPDFINPLSHQGSLQVNLTPPATGGWRFAGEIGWRAPGSTATGLAAGDRRIEYRSAAGHITPVTETLTIALVSGLQAVSRAYVSTSTPGSGRLRVSIKPDSLAAVTNTPLLRAQWRLAGESDSAWRNTDTEAAGLVPGNHVIESKAIAGYETPAPVNVVIGDGQTTLASITYFISADPVGAVPSPLAFNTVAGDSAQPFGFVGQIFSDSGAATGFVVKPRVVATAGHVVFDDGSLSAATNLTWLFQREIGVHEPVPVPPRGFYLMSGYAAQRAIDNTPGVSTPASQNLDAAALYFADNAISRNGYSGYLASDLAENEFLISDRDKRLAGYPVEGVAQEAIGRMHATPAANVGFSQSYLRTYLTTGIRGSGGMSGGPLFVREASGIWYPAAIYLGGTRQMIVRAIDSDVADLFGFAEASAEVFEGSTGGTGVLGASSPLPTPELGGIRVNIAPTAARNAGAGWRINTSDPYQQSATQIVDLSPNTYTVRFSTVPGFLPPTPQTVTVTGGQLATLTFTYEELILPPVITSPTSVTRTRGQNLFYQITTQPAAQTYSLFGALPPGVEFNAAMGQITGIPQAAGAFVLQAGATNLGGSGSKPITLNVLPVLAAQAVPAIKGSALNHPLVSGESGSGMSWSSSQLPDGLVLDAASGVISGVPTVAGVFDVNISLTRNGATASALATFTILGEAPAFTLEPPTNRAIEFGTSTTFVVAASGEPAPTYQWYRGSSGNIANPVIGATSPTFITPVLTEPASFWVRAASIGRTVDSRAVAISLNPSGNAELASLETDAGLPSPSFNSAVLGYRLTVAHTTSTIRMLPTARVSQTSIQVNGQTVVSGTASNPIPVAIGTSRITVQTTAGNGSTVRSYTLDVTRLPLPNAVTDPASSVNDFSARLNGRVIPNGQGEAYFEYGLTTAYGLRTPRQSVAGDQPLAVASDIAGLDPLTIYHFRVVLESGGQVYFDGGRNFDTSRKPPTVATGSVFRSTTADATLTGAVNPHGQNVTLFFEYGLNTLLGARTTEFLPTPNGGNSALDVSKIISGLQANNMYFYRLVAKDEAGVEWRGRIESFTAENSTGTADGIADSAPSVTTSAATDLTTTSATLAGIATPNDGSTEVWFEYGPIGQAFTDSTPIQLIGNGSQPRNATWPISGLVPEASYHFRMMARNSVGETPGSTMTFQTRFNPPVVTIGSVETLSATSVKITGSVDPKGTATAVDFRYGAAGTNFPLGAIAGEGEQTGAGLRPVSVILINLEPSQVYETLIEASSDGGTVGSQTLTFQPGALLGLIQQFPETTPVDERSGQLTVNILPVGTGAWRFAGETLWRASEIPATGLTTGNRVIEFRPEIGYNRPPAESVSIVSGGSPVVVESLYYPAPEPGLAAITVNLEPSSISDASLPTASRAQWRFAGVVGDPWKNSGTTVSELPEGSYLIECKTVSGRQTPLPRAVALANDENRSVTFTYFAATSPILNPPAPISYETAVADPTRSSGYVGQVRSDLGTSSGFAVKRRVVATAAQAVFDEATLALTANIEWLWLPDRNNHAPKPIAARGVYVFDGYAAQRSSEATPGTLSSVSQNLNVAAIYFSEDAARGGSSGFLASDEIANPYLVSSLPKMLAGYPSVNVSPSNLGRLHVLNPTTASFAHVIGRTFDSAFIRGFGGMAGGPLSVRPDNGSFYPAGIYVGGTSRGIVRAIDTPIIDLFSRAEVSGNGGDNDTGGGITHTSFANLTSSKAKGAVTVIIRPASAVTLNAGWRLTSAQSLKDSEAQIGNLTPGTYSLLLSTIPGFPAPPPASIKVESGKTTQVIFDYSAINSEPLISEITNRSINEDTSTLPIAFTIGDMQSSADALTLSRTSSNSALVPNTSIVLSGTGTNRTVTVTPAANQSGTATITISVSDGSLSASRSFLLTVNPVNDTPVFSPIANQNLVVNQVLGPLSFSVSDLETSNLAVSATSSNTALVQNAAIILTGTGANRSLSLIPVAGQIGSTTITLSVSDGLATANRNFLVTVSGTPIDTWRFANFGTAANSGTAADSFDADGDNKSNIDEYAAGTDPHNASDFFRVLSSTRLGSDFRVTVPGRANRNYILQRTPSLTSPVWTPVASSGVLELPATLQLIDDAPPVGSAYYRVLVNAN